MRPEDTSPDAYMLPAPSSEREVSIYQTGYHFGVAEGVRLGRAQLTDEQLAYQAEQAHLNPFPADEMIKRRRALRARQAGRQEAA
ncbi:hypothetical protein [Nesterenkonia xinjiangensis]|uniref:Uncharacterized protein n=1 Tax=Nesterenkonia xinjiangensis TaxID=225327 RepID=A0A7Z0GLL0_9MICC|nr:hypothetical protein [Nesterenkonia xinjiangensis]NYJ78254.1 hypothetical protein [Nesterenkonia xinjiangensis]